MTVASAFPESPAEQTLFDPVDQILAVEECKLETLHYLPEC